MRIKDDAASALIKDKNWECVCENHHGACYWNRVTGELLWLAEMEGESNLSKPSRGGANQLVERMTV